MAKTYFDSNDPSFKSGRGNIIESLNHIKGSGYDTFLVVFVCMIEGALSLKIEAHDPCDKKDHTDCHVVGIMDKPSETDYENTVAEANMLAEAIAESFKQDKAATGPIEDMQTQDGSAN